MEAIYLIDIERAGRRVGSGPITSAISWECEVRLGEVGDFKCKIAATDPQILHVQPYSMLICRAYIQTIGYIEVGRGEVRNIDTSIDPEGRPIVEVSGPDSLNRLAEKSVGYLEIGKVDIDNGDAGNPIPLTDALNLIKAEFDKLELQAGTFAWSFDYSGIADIATKPIAFQFAGETVLAALTKICELADAHFVVDAKNVVKFRKNSDFPDCGTRAIAAPANPDPLVEGTCYIVGTPRIREETRETFTRIIPWGYGRAEDAVGLHLLVNADPDNKVTTPSAWGSPPAGYEWVLDDDPSRPSWPLGIRHVQAEAESNAGYPGRIIEKFKKYQDIEPVLPDDLDDTTTDADGKTTDVYDAETRKAVRARANRAVVQTLIEAAIRDLDEALNRTVHYDLSLLHLNHVVRPGQKIHCVFHYRLGTGWTRVNQWLNITGVRLVVDSQGVRTTDLTVSTVARPPRLDADPLLQVYAWLNRFGA